MNREELVNELKNSLGSAFVAMDMEEYILQPKMLDIKDGVVFEILPVFFQGEWTTWGDRERFLSIAKDLGIQVETEKDLGSHLYSFTVGDTKTTLIWTNTQFQRVTLQVYDYMFCIEIIKQPRKIGLWYNRGHVGIGGDFERAFGNAGQYHLNDIEEVADLYCRAKTIKRIVAQLLAL